MQAADAATRQSFTYDPADPLPNVGGANLFLPAARTISEYQ